jgi:hypothetical protein
MDPGKLADFVVLEDDPWAMEPEDLGRVRVRSTWRGGEKFTACRDILKKASMSW